MKTVSLLAFNAVCFLVLLAAGCGESGNESDYEQKVRRDIEGNCGISWTKTAGNPIIEYPFSGGAFDSYGIKNPWVIRENGTYKMWYAGRDDDHHTVANSTIGYATSPDGINWTPYSTSPVIERGAAGSFDDWHAFMPVVIKDGGTYKMWYTGDGYGVNYLGHATSKDGANWTKYNGKATGGSILDWQAEGLYRYTYTKTVIKDGDTYRMWYLERAPDNHNIGYAESADGIEWDIEGSVLGLGEEGEFDDYRLQSPFVLKTGSGFLMLYMGDDGEAEKMGTAFSADGIEWKRSPYNPVLAIGPSGSWDDKYIRVGSAILEGNTLRMWYHGNDEGPEYNRIGHARSSCNLELIFEDNDSDGFAVARGCGIYPDCNDSDPAISPHAVETIGDDIDYNCDNEKDVLIYFYLDGGLLDKIICNDPSYLPLSSSVVVQGRSGSGGDDPSSGLIDNVSVLKNGWTDIDEDFSGGLDNWTLWGTPLPELIVSRGDPAPALWTRGDNMCDSGAYSDAQSNWLENRWKVSAEGMISNIGSKYNTASLRIMDGFAPGGACAGVPISSYHVYLSSDSGGAVIYGDKLADTTVPDMINAGEWHLMEISNYKAY